MTAPAKLTIDIYSDVMCPWCIIGLRALEQAIDEAALRMSVDPIALRKRWDPDPNRQLNLSEFNVRSVQTTGTISASSASLTVASDRKSVV